MIISIAGTSGSGKSTLVRNFMKWAGKMGVVKAIHRDGFPSYPVGYDIIMPHTKMIHVVGPYGGADTAGCDVLRKIDAAYDRIDAAFKANKHVIFEGLFMMNMTRGPQMVELYGDTPIHVIHLSDPLAVAIASINARREARGEGPLLNKDNTIGNFTRAKNYSDKMRAAGAHVVSVKRAEALGVLVGLLGFDLKHDRVGNFGIC
jgi:hypothetical protein